MEWVEDPRPPRPSGAQPSTAPPRPRVARRARRGRAARPRGDERGEVARRDSAWATTGGEAEGQLARESERTKASERVRGLHPSPARCNVERRFRTLRRLVEALRRGPAARHTSRRGVRSLQGRRHSPTPCGVSVWPAFTAGSPPRRCLPSSSTRLGRRVRRAFDSPCPLRALHPTSRPSRAPPWGRSPPATLADLYPAARPSLRLSPRGRSDPAFRGSWSRLRRHPGERHVLWTVTSTAAPPPGFLTLSAVSSHARASRPSAPRLRGVLQRRSRSALARLPRANYRCRSGPVPLQGSTRRNRVSLPGPLAPSSFGLAPRSSAVITGLATVACPDLPGLLLTPAAFRPTLTEAPGQCRSRSAQAPPSSGDPVRPRVRQTSAQWPVSLQGSSDVSPGSKPRSPRHPQARRTVLTLATLRRPRSVLPPAYPTPFLGIAPDSWVVTFVGFFPSRASFQLQASGPD